jgi:CDP-glucose 4,6-dehydratase
VGALGAVVSRTVLVTGATGLLGGHLAAALLARGDRVVVLLRDVVPDCLLVRSGALARCVQVRGDLTDLRGVERALVEHGARTVFHLGAQTIVGVGKRDPLETWESNVRGTWNVLEAARRHGVDAVAVASSDKVYGESDDLPYRESHPLLAQSPYDASKAAADVCARSYAASYGLPVVVLRCGNLYGPGDLHFSRLVPDMLRARLRGERPVIRSDGLAIRDFLYVEDAVALYLAAAERAGERGIVGTAFNGSFGEGVRVLDAVAAIDEAVSVHEPRPEVRGEAHDEIRAQRLDSGRAQRVLGWRATTGLREGLARTVPWYRTLFTEASSA